MGRNEELFSVAEWLASPPAGGRVQMWIVGGLLAGIVLAYGLLCAVTAQAHVPNITLQGFQPLGKGLFVTVNGTPAVCIGCAAICAGLFAHFQWFWGNHPRLGQYYEIGKYLALLGLVAAIAGYAYFIIVRA